MDAQVADAYERALRRGDEECRLVTCFKGKRMCEYVCEFGTMLQKCTQKSSQRRVRRLIVANPQKPWNMICDAIMEDVKKENGS